MQENNPLLEIKPSRKPARNFVCQTQDILKIFAQVSAQYFST